MQRSFELRWSSQVGVFDENAGFEYRFSPKICNSLPAEFMELEGPSVVYNSMEESARAIWKRLAARVIFESPNGLHIASVGSRRLPSELLSNIRSRLFLTENTMAIFFYMYLKVHVIKENRDINIRSHILNTSLGCFMRVRVRF